MNYCEAKNVGGKGEETGAAPTVMLINELPRFL